MDDPPGYVAMGWHVRRDRHTVWHNGGTSGFRAYVAFHARLQIGVVVLANTDTKRVDDLGLDAMLLLRGQTPQPIALPPSISLPDASLERYVGTYTFAPGVALVVTHTPGTLRARLANQPAFRIHPSSEAEFRYHVVDATLTFEFDPSGRASAVTLHQGGRDQRALRGP
jgi:hypothetical protein